MAGDWIKMRKDLPDDPAVLRLAEELGCPLPQAIGLLFLFWRWADSHTSDGIIRGVKPEAIDRLVNFPDFALTLSRGGWLCITKRFLKIPNFERHLSKSAKARALTNIRAQRCRNGASVTPPLPEKRREENISPIYIPLSFDEFWRTYPLKSKRQEAAEAFANLAPEELPAVLQAAANYAATSAARNGFNMRADRWLRGEWKQWASVPHQAGKPPRLLTREEIQARASQQRKGTPWAG